MADDREVRVRPGRIRSTRAQQARPFIAQALAAARKAGGGSSLAGRAIPGNRTRFGAGQRASVQANSLITARTRGAVIKARVVRHTARSAPLIAHLAYLRRDGVTRDGGKGQLFGANGDTDGGAFAGRCGEDRHHFRFIISPDDAVEMPDLRSFTRDLADQMAKDLSSRLDWVAIDHWNTEHPHVHLIVRGVRDDGQDLVITRDYIKQGIRDRARDLITQELGPRTDLEIRRSLARQVTAERWTELDRQLVRDAGRTGAIDLTPKPRRQPDEFHALKVGRLRALEALGVSEQTGPAQWIIKPEAEAIMHELGQRGDIIKRMHRALTEQGIERGSAAYVLAAENLGTSILGRLVARGLDEELHGTAYAVVDGVDGRIHHIRLPDLDAAGDGAIGAIVELRAYEDARGRQRKALAVRSDLDLTAQITASGATWLDRQAIGEPASLSDGGFGGEVSAALEQRAEFLVDQGLATRRGTRVVFTRNLIETLRRRELDAVAAKLVSETGRQFNRSAAGESIAGTYRRRLALASGRYAMLDDGPAFNLVPWSPSLEKQLGRHVSGVVRGNGGVDWTFGRKRDLGL